jgi:hypothetical protein
MRPTERRRRGSAPGGTVSIASTAPIAHPTTPRSGPGVRITIRRRPKIPQKIQISGAILSCSRPRKMNRAHRQSVDDSTPINR